jgi:hypothetical protein
MIDILRDEEGRIITCPVTSMGVTPLADIASLVLTLQYVETPEELEINDYSQLQFQLTAPLALELARELERVATLLLAAVPSGTKTN